MEKSDLSEELSFPEFSTLIPTNVYWGFVNGAFSWIILNWLEKVGMVSNGSIKSRASAREHCGLSRVTRGSVDPLKGFEQSGFVKTITTRQAVQQFKKFSKMAHAGKRVLVTNAGQPWIVFESPRKIKQGLAPTSWPDYPSHWRKHFPNGPSHGPTATELLAQEKEDRF